jgi:hypothetical protein
MKKILYGVLASLALVLALSLPARADRATEFGAAMKSNPQGARASVAPQVCRTSLSSTCVVCSSAGKSGIIVAIDVSSGAVGSYAVAYDTGAIPSVGLVGPPASSGAGALLARQKTCEYTLATVDTNKGSCGLREFAAGKSYSNGLTICGSADVQTIVQFYDIRIP